jgi:hypothetical protein
LQIKTKIVSSHTAISKPVKQEVNGTVILPPLVFPDTSFLCLVYLSSIWALSKLDRFVKKMDLILAAQPGINVPIFLFDTDAAAIS